ncbi:3-phosphoshikimate 1-carboxyvinyltransferase [Stenoxybacter acetivorans]|uniref:3-phosphoshikimate 1-carboxyvinyltransferase n=1 Tax=Stenoxybacter acetivorans TaxID=422441 RepID=UPI000560E456|nr:3-phosphoshikimate 1-carboxyvinyltransferase [Stenoxybacter acetivorans]
MTSPSLYLPPRKAQASVITLPGSKSISNRILLLSALAGQTTEIISLLYSDDTAHMINALEQLGIHTEKRSGSLFIHGCSGRFKQKQASLFLGNAGTAFRPLTAVLAVLGGEYQLSGVPRMHERPIGDLVDALRQLGASIDYLGEQGFPPLRIGKFKNSDVPIIRVNGNVSSQFLTALLLALPLTGKAQTIEVIGELISKPYIDITLNLMEKFGVLVNNESHRRFHLPANAVYQTPGKIYVEGDASGASYFQVAGLLSGSPIRVQGVGKNSIQGDAAFAAELAKIGATVVYGDDFIEVSREPTRQIDAFDLDANHIPDAAMTLAIVALAANGTSTLRNIGSWRVKETDRIAAMSTELRRLGATVLETEDSIQITPPKKLIPNVHIHTYDDHRMAMCFSLVSLLDTPIYINDPQCVNKTFPDYFQIFETLSHSVQQPNIHIK